MPDASYFLHPVPAWQRRYEALRASFVDRLPAKVVADRFGYTHGYLRLLRHQFVHGKLDFSEPTEEGTARRRGVNAQLRAKIRKWREQKLSAGEIAQLLSDDSVELSVRTVERILAEEGFSKLPRRTRLKIGLTAAGAQVPSRAEPVDLAALEGKRFECAGAGAFLFAPFIEQLDIAGAARDAGLTGTKALSTTSYVLAFLALKLLGTERYAHVGDHAFDPGLGLFCGLNVLPKCTAMSTYSYSLDDSRLQRFQQAFIRRASKLGLFDGKIVNLDFHTIPHYGEESVLQEHWAGARNRTMKGALTLLAQDAQSKLLLWSAADIQREEADDQVLAFLSFWRKVQRGVHPKLVFDSRFTTYGKLDEINAQGIKFITLRRRGKKLIDAVDGLAPWTRIHIPHVKRKFPNPQVHESFVKLRGYDGDLRQLIVRGNGREKPAFLITNDFDSPIELLVGDYARRWRVENGIAEAVKFFHLNSLSSPILTKVHFDVVLTMIADTLYSMLANKLRGFESCDAPKIFRNFVRSKGTVSVRKGHVSVVFPRRAHNPILRAVAWDKLPAVVPGLPSAGLSLQFQ